MWSWGSRYRLLTSGFGVYPILLGRSSQDESHLPIIYDHTTIHSIDAIMPLLLPRMFWVIRPNNYCLYDFLMYFLDYSPVPKKLLW